ncbi:MAG: tetratricopeptide repeat protein [Anaerolineaceae bacterium]|nr:tetratricopeptide repeat protein [Anaerolineaceae bacterium]
MSVSIEDRGNQGEQNNFSRKDLLVVLRAAQSVNAYRFTRQATMEWLSIYPGDLEINLWLAKALIGEGRLEQALEIIEKLCAIDPEYTAVWRLAAELYAPGSSPRVQAVSALQALGRPAKMSGNLLPWSSMLFSAREQLQKDELTVAEQMVYTVLSQYPDAVLGAIQHLKLLEFAQDETGLLSYSRVYHVRWPTCLHFSLLTAKGMLDQGEETEAMQLFQQCVASDPEGRVASRLWGSEHVYQPLWPGELNVRFELAVPADVAYALGLNQLSRPSSNPEEYISAVEVNAFSEGRRSAGNVDVSIVEGDKESPIHGLRKPGVERKSPRDVEEVWLVNRRKRRAHDSELAAVEKAFERLAEKYHDPKLNEADGRFPVYVVFSTKSGLEKKYGGQIEGVFEKEMQRLAATISNYPDWGGLVFIPDDPKSVDAYGLSAVDEVDPWTLKLALVDLDQALAKKGSMIGALLIVGGGDVVPFHHLPNPTDDMDEDVPSDNPYATLDGNYFVPEWPAGRLPDEKGSDPAFLLKQLRKVINEHQGKISGKKTINITSWLEQFIAFLVSLFARRKPTSIQIKNGFGYSAAVWRRSSIAAFRPIGDGQCLEVSPPEPKEDFDYNQIMESGLGYFNLHGLADAPEWYGQRDITEPYVGPDYPIALRPSDLVKNGKTPRVVFSEACYGGHVFGKRESDSLALRFLSVGTSAVVASTCIAYGSVSPPLIGADLLANYFWLYLQEGMSSGEALLRAKIDFVRQMEKRQGFMDGEDQKTMISFVLYGDPLARGNGQQVSAKSITRLRARMEVRMVCDIKENGEVDCCEKDVVSEAKQLVEVYLPGIENAEISVSKEYQIDNEYFRRKDLGASVSSTSYAKGKAGRTVVTVRKQAKSNAKIHHHYARVTMDKNGKIVKLAISR